MNKSSIGSFSTVEIDDFFYLNAQVERGFGNRCLFLSRCTKKTLIPNQNIVLNYLHARLITGEPFSHTFLFLWDVFLVGQLFIHAIAFMAEPCIRHCNNILDYAISHSYIKKDSVFSSVGGSIYKKEGGS